MQWLLSILSTGIVVSFFVLHREVSLVEGLATSSRNAAEKNETGNGLITNDSGKEGLTGRENEEDVSQDPDFQDEEEEPSARSLTHMHRNKGEILVPCFGMWWPVGGAGGGVYEYEGDYYGDYRKKRRRSRKQKKAARMKKKKARVSVL